MEGNLCKGEKDGRKTGEEEWKKREKGEKGRREREGR